MRFQRVSIGRIGLAAAAAGIALNAVAQEDISSEDEQVRLKEVVVTAQKTRESLQDTPVAVTAFSQVELESRSIDAAQSLQLKVPNLSYSATNFGNDNFTIRGIGRTAIGDGAENGVAYIVNQVYVQSGTPADFFDLEQVEVLRGPQGTLFGRNATGGAITIATARPKSDFEARAEVTVGSYGIRSGEYMLNLPVSEQIALRLAGTYGRSDGDVQNITTDESLNGGEDYDFRLSAAWEPDDKTDLVFVAEYSKKSTQALQGQRQLCTRDPIGNLGCLPDSLGSDFPNFQATLGGLRSYADLDPFTPGLQSLYDLGVDPFSALQQPEDFWTIAQDIDPEVEDEDFFATLEFSRDFGRFQFDSVTGYTKSEGYYQHDADFGSSATPFNIVPGVFDDGFVPLSLPDPQNRGSLSNRNFGLFNSAASLTRADSENSQWLQELRVKSDIEGPVNFLVGAFYLNFEESQNFYTASTGIDALGVSSQSIADFFGVDESFAPPFFRLETPVNDIKSSAIFGEAYYQPSDNLTLTAGLRYTEDEKRQVNRSLLLGEEPFEANKDTFNAWTGRAGFDWKPDLESQNDVLLYGFYSRGFKAGGFNPQGVGNDLPRGFESEFVDAFEIGVKTEYGNSLRANIAAFHYNYDGLQVAKSVGQATINENIDARISGFEVEFLYAPSSNLSLDLSIGALNSSIGNAKSVDPRDPTAGDPNLIAIKDVSSAANCVATIEQLFIDLGGEPFGDCAASGLQDGVAVDLKGNELANAPKLTAGLGAEYRYGLGDSPYDLTVRGDLLWRSEFWARNFNRDPVDRIDSWSRLNLYASLTSSESPWYAFVNVSNVLDDNDVTGLFLEGPSSGLTTKAFYLAPRTVTLSVGRAF